MRSLDFFNLPNPSSRTMGLGSTQSLTEMSTRNLLGSKGWHVRLTTLPPSMSQLSRKWEPRRLTTLWAPMACYKDNFTFYTVALENDYAVLFCCRDFAFWYLPQIQYKNPNVQVLTLTNMTPSPFITCFFGK
jgi:hypothetical protein